MEEWILLVLQQKQIRNYSCKNILETLGETIPLEDYDLLSIGYEDQRKEHKKITFFRILKHFSQKSILQGPHEILVYTNISHSLPPRTAYKFWVYSLTRLRLLFFKMKDRLSFERSTFLIDRKHQRMIRLKSIRDKIVLPIQNVMENVNVYISTEKNIFSNEITCRKNGDRLNFSELTKKQLYHQMEMFWVMYARHMGKHYSKNECKVSILQYFETFLKQM